MIRAQFGNLPITKKHKIVIGLLLLNFTKPCLKKKSLAGLQNKFGVTSR